MRTLYLKKRLITFIFLLSLLLLSCREPAADIETYTAGRGDIVHTTTSTGYIDSKEVRNYSLQAAGEILFAMEKGQSFSDGETIFEVDNQRTLLAIDQAKENLAVSEISLAQAEISYQQALDNHHIAVQLADTNKQLARQSTESALIALQDAQRLASRSDAYAKASLDMSRETANTAQVAYQETQQAIEDGQTGTDNVFFINGFQIRATEDEPNITQIYLDGLNAELEAAQRQADLAQASYEQARAQATAQVHSAESAYKQAQSSESITYWSTFAETQNARAQIRLAKESLNHARSQLNLARINVEMASLDLGNNKVIAPFGGLVLASPFSEGETASPGMHVISIISEDFIITSDISETDIGRLKVGQQVNFTLDAHRGREYSGQIIEISPIPENIGGIVTFRVKVAPDNTHDFLYGLTANLTISSILAENVLLAPIEAVYEEDGREYVDILKEEEILKREVKTGTFSYDYIEILSGLQQGDRIIISRMDYD